MYDYESFGFECDDCMVKFDQAKLTRYLIEFYLNALYKSGYPLEITEFNYQDH